ncbi:hypothetical protein PAMP_022267 [Pampus punctatissimus]
MDRKLMPNYSEQWNLAKSWALMGTEPVRIGFLSVWTQTRIKHTLFHFLSEAKSQYEKFREEVEEESGKGGAKNGRRSFASLI